ncbi:MAG: hypothetical protein GX465_16510, partial [Acidobacteria bacterium]|nr:hypothetical protein [Acidobacteriota bacterium]
MRVHEIIKNAVNKNKIEILIPLDIDGQTVEFMLDELDAYDIQEANELKTQQAMAKAVANNLVSAPLPDGEWESFLKEQDEATRARYLREGRPKDRAEFFVLKTSGIRMLFDVITDALKLPTGEKVFTSDEDKRVFVRWLSTNRDAMNKLFGAYAELTRKVKETRDEAKKS